MSILSRFVCHHDPENHPLSYFCDKNCWTSTGLSSRYIEAFMKKINAVGRIKDAFPSDYNDFGRCVNLLNFYPEWKPRLNEMKICSLNWNRLISKWNTFQALYYDLLCIKYFDPLNNNKNNKKYAYFNYLINGLSVDGGLLLTYHFKCLTNIINFKLKEYLVVGSLVLQPHNQEDEYDIYPVLVVDIYPKIMCNIFNKNGETNECKKAFSYLPISDESTLSENNLKNNFEFMLKNKLIKKINNQMNEDIIKKPITWRSSNFHYCPHYILYADGENTNDEKSFEMFVANVYPIINTNDEWKLGMCFISISLNHPLHPSNKQLQSNNLKSSNDEDIGEDIDEYPEKIFNGEKWVIGNVPIKLYTYYNEGLINCTNFDEPTTLSTEEIEKITNNYKCK